MSLNEMVGQRLKVIRIYGGYKQKELANILQIPAPLLSMYEKGKREPSISLILNFCTHFKMSLSQFFIFHNQNEFSDFANSEKELINDVNNIISNLEKLKLQHFGEKIDVRSSSS